MYKAARYYHVWTDRTERDAVCSSEGGGGLGGGEGGGNVGSAAKGLPWGFGHLQGIRIINESVLLSLFP